MTVEGGLGRRVPTDWNHVERHPLMAPPESALVKVEKILRLPWWYYEGQHNQGEEGACVGFGVSLMMAMVNSYAPDGSWKSVRYNPWWLWDEAKRRDEWNDTNPGDSNGTSVRAACDVLRDLGHVRVRRWPRSYPSLGEPVDRAHGIKENRWAKTVDEMRATLHLGLPVNIGVNWYSNFDTPVFKRPQEWVIGEGDLGRVRGGHDATLYGASDRRQAFKLANSWGRNYPVVWLPYTTTERLIREDGEVALITDL